MTGIVSMIAYFVLTIVYVAYASYFEGLMIISLFAFVFAKLESIENKIDNNKKL